jgi:hypothetical protein
MWCSGDTASETVREKLQFICTSIASNRAPTETGRNYARVWGQFMLWLSVNKPEAWEEVRVICEPEAPAAEQEV